MAVLIEREIVDAHKYVDDRDYEWWRVVTENPDKTLHVYMLPAVTFENLAGEYGFDEDDIDLLLRVAILQLHIPDYTVKRSVESDVAARKGMVRRGEAIWLGNAVSLDEAREAHMTRVDWVEENLVKLIWPKEGVMKSVSGDRVDAGARLKELKSSYSPRKDRVKKRKEMMQMQMRSRSE